MIGWGPQLPVRHRTTENTLEPVEGGFFVMTRSGTTPAKRKPGDLARPPGLLALRLGWDGFVRCGGRRGLGGGSLLGAPSPRRGGRASSSCMLTRFHRI